jgi:hypothetical protein
MASSGNDYRERLIAARTRIGDGPAQMAARLLTPLNTYKQWESGARRTPGVAVVAAEAFAPNRMVGNKLSGRPTDLDRDAKILATAKALKGEDGTVSVSAIQKEVSANRVVIYRVLKAAGIPASGKRGKLVFHPNRSIALEMLSNTSKTVEEIAHETGMGPSSLWAMVRKEGIKRPRNVTKRDRIIEMLERGAPIAKIILDTGASGALIGKIAIELAAKESSDV